MWYRALADLLVVVHLAFVAFVLLGGLLVLRWRWAAFVHLPAAAWGVAIQLAGWICPLTPIENALRSRSGEEGYGGGFVEHYLLAVLYPAGLTPNIQHALGVFVLVVNGIVYAWIVHRARRDRAVAGQPGAATRDDD